MTQVLQMLRDELKVAMGLAGLTIDLLVIITIVEQTNYNGYMR